MSAGPALLVALLLFGSWQLGSAVLVAALTLLSCLVLVAAGRLGARAA